MSKQQDKARIEKLRKLISEYRYEYHVNNNSLMSEAAADGLKHELSQLEEKHPELVTPDSPTQRVAGKPLPQFRSVEHSSRMLSLNDVFNSEELNAWLERISKLLDETEVKALEYFVDFKMDGFSCSLVYQDGLLQTAVTRGDGFVGEDITQNIKTLDSVPLKLRLQKDYQYLLEGRTEIRGEVLMYRKDFDELNRQRKKAGEPLFKNPRNTAAGTMRQLDSALVLARTLHFHGFDLLRENPAELASYKNVYETLGAIGIITNRNARLFTSLDQVQEFARKWESKRDTLPYGTDGLAIKVNDRSVYSKLGVVGKAPRAAVAFKFPAEEATTKVKDIILSVGRTGAATPVAVLEPVNVAGSTVQHASLHNQDEIERKDIRIGDTVIIHKAGDIIPQVVRVLTELRDGSEKAYNMEKELRDHPLEFERIEGEAAWRAINKDNPDILKRGLQHFVSKGALDIDGFGEKNVDLLVEEGLVKDFADIYLIKKENLLDLERFADISAEKLLSAIASAKNPTLHRFIYGLGIRHVGAQTAIDLAQHYKTFDKLRDSTFEELAQIDGVGEIVAHSILEWFSNDANLQLLAKFKDLEVWPQNESNSGGPLDGKSFAITGKLDSMDRDKAAEKIRNLGGTFQSSVGKGTDYLVHGAILGDSKRLKAEKFGTKLLNERDFINLIKT